MKNKNVLWEFFASVKLAIFTFITLAVTSIIGTVIPQNEPLSYYVQHYGQTWATIFRYLDVPDMYHAWWFLSFLVLFCLNLVVCSLERIPNVVRILKQDNLAIDPSRLGQRRGSHTLMAKIGGAEAGERLAALLAKSGWSFSRRQDGDGVLFFAEKGGWTRFSVYVVHGSILLIFIGAIIGQLFGYKASVMIPEGSSTSQVYQSNEEHTPIPLGFELFCDRFVLHYYDSGMPKDYISDLRVVRDGKVVLQKQIEVNDPLDYAGLTFYQSSYQAIDGQYVVRIGRESDGATQNFIIPPKRQMRWPEAGVTFGIVERRNPNMLGQYQHKIWFSDAGGPPVTFWVAENRPVKVQRPNGSYTFEIKQRFATGLQVAKDPGVWTVYIGCTLMILGLFAVFFLSHRRVWVWVADQGRGSRIVVAGNANKNKGAFDNDLAKIVDLVRNESGLGIDA